MGVLSVLFRQKVGFMAPYGRCMSRLWEKCTVCESEGLASPGHSRRGRRGRLELPGVRVAGWRPSLCSPSTGVPTDTSTSLVSDVSESPASYGGRSFCLGMKLIQ